MVLYIQFTKHTVNEIVHIAEVLRMNHYHLPQTSVKYFASTTNAESSAIGLGEVTAHHAQ